MIQYIFCRSLAATPINSIIREGHTSDQTLTDSYPSTTLDDHTAGHTKCDEFISTTLSCAINVGLKQSTYHFKDENDRNVTMTKANGNAENSLVQREIRGAISSISANIQDEYLDDKLEKNTSNDNPHILHNFSKKNSRSILIQKLLIRTVRLQQKIANVYSFKCANDINTPLKKNINDLEMLKEALNCLSRALKVCSRRAKRYKKTQSATVRLPQDSLRSKEEKIVAPNFDVCNVNISSIFNRNLTNNHTQSRKKAQNLKIEQSFDLINDINFSSHKDRSCVAKNNKHMRSKLMSSENKKRSKVGYRGVTIPNKWIVTRKYGCESEMAYCYESFLDSPGSVGNVSFKKLKHESSKFKKLKKYKSAKHKRTWDNTNCGIYNKISRISNMQ